MIEPGQPAPAFALPDQEGKPHELRDFRGRPVVLYFYPKDNTSGCTDEACQFRDQLPDFTKATAVVLGVSPDDVRSHAKFAAKHQLNFKLLADERDASDTPLVCDSYGVWKEKSMYGNTFMGVQRTTYLIDRKGAVAHRWDKVKVPGHAEDVLKAVQALR